MSTDNKNTKAIENIIEQLKLVAPIINELAPEVRTHAFDLFRPYLSSLHTSNSHKPLQPEAPSTRNNREEDSSSGSDSIGEFFGKHSHDKPGDNVMLIAAWHYGEYGAEPLTTTDISKLASNVGLTVPARPDMTLKKKAVSGKSCFKIHSRGAFTPTVHGEAFLKETYQVKKGKKSLPKELAD